MKDCCASCIWFEVDEFDGESYCTVNPPDHKGRYPKVSPQSKCKNYEDALELDYETKDVRRS